MVAMARCGVLRAPLTMTRAAANGGANKGNKQVGSSGNPKGPGPGRAGKAKPRRGVNGVGAMKMGSDSPMTGRIGEEIQGQQSAAEGGEEGKNPFYNFMCYLSLMFLPPKPQVAVDEDEEGAGGARDPVFLESSDFLRSLVDAASDPVGMPEAMLKWAEIYRDETVGIENPIGPGCISTIDPEVVEHVCKTNAANYRDRLLPDVFNVVLKGMGVTGSQGDYNRHHRKTCQKPFMNKGMLQTFSKVVESRAEHLCQSWERACPTPGSSSVQDVDLASQHLLLDIISPISFDYDFGMLEQTRSEITGEPLPAELTAKSGESNRMLDAYHESAEVMGEVILQPLPLLQIQSALGFGRLRQLQAAYATLEEVGDAIVKRRRAEHEAAEARGEEPPATCLLDTLLQMRDEDTGEPLYTDEELFGDVNDIMAAGHQTQAATYTNALLHVARHPDVKARAEREVARLGRAPTFEDVESGNLPYLEAVVKEVMRLYPPIHMYPRLASEADVMPSGHKIESGDMILMSTWAMGRNPRIWDEPDKFDPERFSDAGLTALAKRVAGEGATEDDIERRFIGLKSGRDFVYTPFGAGPRSCIGGHFATLTVTTCLAASLRRFDFSPAPKLPADARVPFRYDVTICFPDGVPIKLTKRDLEADGSWDDAAELAFSAGPVEKDSKCPFH